MLKEDIFEIIEYLTHPISLLSIACSLIIYYFINRNIKERKKLIRNPELYEATAERLEICLLSIPKNQRPKIVIKKLNNLILKQVIAAISIIIVGIYISILIIEVAKIS